MPARGGAARSVLRSRRGSLPYFAAALARIQSGSGRAVHAAVGDSVTSGHGTNVATGTGSGANAGTTDYRRNLSYVHKLAALWTAAGFPARSDAVWGNGFSANNTIAEYTTANSNVSFGAGWAVSASDSIGCRFFQNSTTTNSYTLTPEFASNRLDVWKIDFTDGGPFTVTDTSGTLATLTTLAGAGAFSVSRVTRALDTTAAYNIKRTTGTTRIVALVPWSTASPRLEVWNMGYGGADVATQLTTTNAWSPGNAFDGVLAAGDVDLWTFMQGINDKGHSITSSTYQTNLTSMLNKLKGGGKDVLMVKEHKVNAGAYDLDATWLAAIDAASAAAGLLSPLNMNALPLVTGDWYDTLHLAGQGADKMAMEYRALIAARARVF
jgi:hypothetical protein